MTNLIATLAAAYVLITAAMFLFQRQLMYYPDSSLPSPEASGLVGVEVVTSTTEDGLDLGAWYRPARGAAPTVAYFHGNAGHIGHRAGKARPLLEAGLGILLVEYRGYGGNPGSPDERGLLADGRAALAFLADRGVGPERIVLYGESLGSGVAVALAAEMAARSAPAAGLVLEAPFTSIADVAQIHYPFLPARWLVRDRFDSAARIGAVRAPVLVLLAEDDRVVPARLGRRLFEAAREPKVLRVFPGAGHEDLFEAGAARAVLDFLAGSGHGER